MNMLEDLLNDSELEIYKVTEYPFSLSIVYNALKQKQKTEPGYEVWVPFVYYSLEQLRRSDRWLGAFRPIGIFISNKGRVCSFRRNKMRILKSAPREPGDYVVTPLNLGKYSRVFVTHRALACSFLPLDKFLLSNEDILTAHPRDLQVNHVDGMKDNCSLDNLEWSTHSGNQIHASSIGLIKSGKDSVLTKSVKGKVEVGPYKGHEFILHGVKEYRLYGFTQPSISVCCRNSNRVHRNCSWSYATAQDLIDIPRGITNEVRLSLEGSIQKIR